MSVQTTTVLPSEDDAGGAAPGAAASVEAASAGRGITVVTRAAWALFALQLVALCRVERHLVRTLFHHS